MKKNFTKLLCLSIAMILFLTGCGQFADGGGSVWQGGLWVIPTLTLAGAAWFGYRTYVIHYGGSNIIEAGAVTDKEGGNIPIYQLGQFWYSVTLFVATLIIIFMVNSDK